MDYNVSTFIKKGLGTEEASFESKFPIGDPIQIEIENKKCRSVLRGLKLNEYLLADIPMENGKPVPFSYNTQFTVRFLSSGTAYGFKLPLLRIHTKQRLFAFDYPKKIDSFNLRKSERIQVLIPAKVQLGMNSSELSGAILNLSSDGALFAVHPSNAFQVGQKLKSSTVLPNRALIPSITCSICSIQASADKMFLGVKFIDSGDVKVEDQGESPIAKIRRFYNFCYAYLLDNYDTTFDKRNTKFQVGHEISLQFAKEKVDTSLRGWKLGKHGYIFVEPLIPGLPPISLKKGIDVITRFTRAGKIYGLMARFNGILEKTGLWILEFQEDMMENSLRSEQRIHCLNPVIFVPKKDEEMGGDSSDEHEELGRGVMINLSLDGAKLRTKKDFLGEDYLWLSFTFGTMGVIENLRMKILRTEKIGTFFDYAGSFTGADRETKEKFKNFLKFYEDWVLE